MLIGLCILGGLLLMAMIRMVVLARSNRRMRLACVQMEKQAAAQQIEILATHHDANSWRAKTQRQFDALRSDFACRLLQADQGGQHALKHLEDLQQQKLAAAEAKISELEERLAEKPATTVLPKIAAPAATLPALPAMETLRLVALEDELAVARTEIAASRQQAATLQRALLLARRRPPAQRKTSTRGPARGA